MSVKTNASPTDYQTKYLHRRAYNMYSMFYIENYIKVYIYSDMLAAAVSHFRCAPQVLIKF